MKISFLVSSFPSLSETFILNQITGFIEAGHDVTIYAGSRGNDEVVHEDIIKHSLLRRTVFYNNKPQNRFLRVVTFLFLFPALLFKASRPVLNSINVVRYRKEALSLNLFFKVLQFLSLRDSDIIACHFGRNGQVGLLLRELGLTKGKLVTFFHGSDLTTYVEKQGRDVYKGLFEKGDLFLAISDFSKRKLIGLGCSEDKIRVHRMGINLTDFSVNIGRGRKDGALRILSVARLIEKKGLCYGVEAVAMLKSKGLNCEYLIVGDGPLRSQLEEQAASLQVLDRISFVGWKNSGAVRRCFHEADLLLAPSLEEGIPVVLMEAMACGVPVITTPVGGIPEIVEDGSTGFLVTAGSAGSIADAVERIYGNASSVQDITARARERIIGAYDVRKLNNELFKIFSELAYAKEKD